jgi:hypothetical protein
MNMLKTLSILLLSAALIGCAHSNEPRIASRGDVVAQGTGQLSFRSPGPGLVSVYDVNDNSVINSSAVDADSVVSINPVAGNITVTDATRAGTQIVHTGVNRSHRYEVWFIPQRQVEEGVLRRPPATEMAPTNGQLNQ